MKTTLKLLALITILTITSCGVKDVVMKRKYNKGYYVDINNNKQKARKNNIVEQSTLTVTTNNQEEKFSTDITEQQEAQTTNADLTASTDETHPYIKAKTPINFSAKKNQKNTAVKSQTKVDNIVVKENFKTKLVKRIVGKKIKSTANNNSGSANTILLVILSLFPILCLIAIYIKDGNRTTTNFWVDFLLHFLFLIPALLGIWGIGISFFLPAIIFALLVVLNVINLA